jgi:hypothetical protein
MLGVPDNTVGSCLEPELPGIGPQGGRGNAEPGPPSLKERSQLEPCRDRGDMISDREESIWDGMQEGQRPPE